MALRLEREVTLRQQEVLALDQLGGVGVLGVELRLFVLDDHVAVDAVDDLAAAAAGGTCAFDGEEALRRAHFAMTGAGGAGLGAMARLGAVAVAVLAAADDVVGDLPPDAGRDLGQLDLDRDRDVAPADRSAPAAEPATTWVAEPASSGERVYASSAERR